MNINILKSIIYIYSNNYFICKKLYIHLLDETCRHRPFPHFKKMSKNRLNHGRSIEKSGKATCPETVKFNSRNQNGENGVCWRT